MNSSLFVMKKVLSLASEPQVRWKYLKPLQISRNFARVKSEKKDSEVSKGYLDNLDVSPKDFFEENTSENMKPSINEVKLLGRVAEDPVENDDSIVFKVATSDLKKDGVNGTLRKITEWHSIVSSNVDLSKAVKNQIRKGQRIYLTGSLNYTTEGKRSRILLNNFIKL